MNLSKALAATAAITAALALAAPASAANLIVNGGFEAAPNPANGQFLQLFGGATFTGWTVTGNDILLIDRNYNEDTLVFNANTTNVAADLTGAGNTSPLDGVYQDVLTTAGQSYLLSFFVGNAAPIGSNEGVYRNPSIVDLSIDNGTRISFTNASTAGTSTSAGINYQQFSYSFVATGATTRISFLNGTPVGDNYAGLDDVSLIAAVPEPASWAMMILGFFGLGSVVRRRRTAVA